jgi:zinc-binding alcohol dehydrogenase/oxidoreductase
VRAVVQEAYGGPGVLQPADLPDPVPDAAHAVVRVHAAALNWHDVLVRRGQYHSPLPHVPGADGAGIDVETGEAVVVIPSLYWGSEVAAPGPDWEILGDHRPACPGPRRRRCRWSA